MEYTIMAVDDSKFILAAVNDALKDSYTLILQNSVVEALDHLKKEIPDLIILDIVMPTMDGYQMIEKMKENPATCNIPVVFLSANDRDTEQDQATDIGVLDYIEKPFKPNYLKKRVSLYIELIASKKRIERQSRQLEDLIESIPGGLIRYSADEDAEFDFVSQGYLKIFGLSEQEFRTKYKNKFLNTIYELDRERVLKFFNKQLEHMRADDVLEYRIINAKGEIVWIYDKGRYTVDHDGKSWFYVAVVDVTEYKKIQEILRKSEQRYKIWAEHDQLTQFFNKNATKSIINNYVEDDGRYDMHAMFAIDLDNFKAINDNFGHLFGDKVLIQTSKIINGLFRSSDILGRFGGDEFVVFMLNISNENSAVEKGNELVKMLTKKYKKDGMELEISASVGISYYPKHGIDFDKLYKKADEALYGAKKDGKKCYYVYDDDC